MKEKHAAFAFPSLRLCTAQFLLHVEEPALQAVILLPQPFHCLGGLLLFRGKLYGDLTVLIVYRLQVIHDSFSADHGDADALPEILHAQEFYRSDLSRIRHMSSAAGTEIRPREFHQTDLSLQFLFASVGKRPQFLLRRIKNSYRTVFPDFPVDFLLDLLKLFPGENAAEINGDHVASHMKAHVIVPIRLMDQSAHHVLAGMLLHQVESPLPVDLSFHFCSRFQRFLCIMDQFPLFLLNVCDSDIVQGTQIAGLPAAFRIKGALIQKDPVALICFPAFRHCAPELLYINVFIV